MDRQNYVQFVINPVKLEMTVESHWECRTAGLLKIMTRVFENLQEAELIRDEYVVRINTADGPSKDAPPHTERYLEFDTSTELIDESNIFPDYIFGNWWHIGLRNFDDFTQDICSKNSLDNIRDGRIFWIGTPQGVGQRIKYLEMCSSNPEKLCGHQMHWINHGRTPVKFVPIKDHCDFKYLIDLTGQGVSGRLKMLPFCNRPLFITDRRLWAWSDILIIKQNLHIRVKDDLSDLLDKYEWANHNYKNALEKGKELLEFCSHTFKFSKVCEKATHMICDAMDKSKEKRKKNGMKFDVVVAHYTENLDWIDRLNHDLINKIFVYTKSDKAPELKNKRVICAKLPNVGRESHTYLHHCVDNYEKIKQGSSDFVFFVQGSPHGMDETRIPKWIDDIVKYRLSHTYNFRFSSPYDFLNKGRCNDWHGAKNESAGCDVKDWCNKFAKPTDKFHDIPIFWNACFGVSAERILSNQKSKYEKTIEALSTPNPECGHYCERLWYYIFNMDDVKNSTPDDCYDFWGGADAKNHHGIIKLNKDGTVGFYSHHNESFWKTEGDTITLMDASKRPTSILNKVGEGEYSGPFISDQSIKHRLIKI